MLQRATAAEIRERHFSNAKAESTPGLQALKWRNESEEWTQLDKTALGQ